MEEAEELRKIIEESTQGNWIPVTIVSAIFGIVIVLIIYIWKQNIKSQDERHENYKSKQSEHKEWLVKLSENSSQNSRILERLEVWKELHQKDYDKLKEEFKEVS